MELHPENPSDINTNRITSYAHDHLFINHSRYESNLILTPERLVTPWACHGFEGLQEDDFAAFLLLQPTVVLLGTGSQQRFLPPSLLRPLIDAGIGCEIMDLGAACRTYNLLSSERRAVAAGLLLDPLPPC